MAIRALRARSNFQSSSTSPRDSTPTTPTRRVAPTNNHAPKRRSLDLGQIGAHLRRDTLTVPRVAAALLLLLLFLLVVILSKRSNHGPLRIPDRPFALQPYEHLDFAHPIQLGTSTRIFHVTKEFGPATMGGLGVMLTALSIAQSESPYLHISIIMPHYSFLRDDPLVANRTKKFTELSIPVRLKKGGERKRVGCRVSVLKWEYTTVVDFLNPVSAAKKDTDEDTLRSIDIFLIGPGDEYPFKSAFKAKDAGDVYSAYKPLKQEWKDLWFAKAAAELVAYLSYNDGSSVFVEHDMEDAMENMWDFEEDDPFALSAPPHNTPPPAKLAPKAPPVPLGVDVVHLHGATNAMVAFFLREMDDFDIFGQHAPAVVYTLHDSLDEVEYSNLLSNLLPFLHEPDPQIVQDVLAPYLVHGGKRGTQLFTSALGIDLAEMVTFVSRSIARSIVEGSFVFSLQSLVMPSISARAATASFIGITNGLDFTDPKTNPFTHPGLLEQGIAFPRVGPNVTDSTTFPTSSFPNHARSFADTKHRAKAHLIDSLPHLFSHDDLDRPWFLFIGRFQYNKGCQFFLPLLELFSSSTSSSTTPYNARLILLGAHNNYPSAALTSLASRFPDHVTLLADGAFQAAWGTPLRMASDYAFVPSFSEAFGLVAAEGMLFGMPVVSTGVGGLLEFLRPVVVSPQKEEEGGNAYLFSLSGRTKGEEGGEKKKEDYGISAEESRMSDKALGPAVEACRDAVRAAVRDWRRLKGRERWWEREMRVRRMVAHALELKWSREQGPVEEYVRVYDIALQVKHTDESNQVAHSIDYEDYPASLSLPTVSSTPSPPKPSLAAPNIAHGGHDKVSGAEVIEQEHGGALPIFKVWSPGQPALLQKPAKRRTKKSKGSKKGKGKGVKEGAGAGKRKGVVKRKKQG